MQVIDDLVRRVVEWAASRPDVVAVALGGSHARDAPRLDSDVDLMIVTEDPAAYVEETGWVATFGEVRRVAVEDWGAVTSVRVHYRDGVEAEFGVTSPAWAATDPLDPGTERVVRDGFRVLHDPSGLLARLKECVTRSDGQHL